MGLLDMFNDPQAAGLLGAGAQILERSGDTSRPYGIAQAMGTGISSYMQINQAMQARKRQEEQERQQQAMRDMQMQEMQAEMAQKQRAQEEAVRLQQFYAQPQDGAQQAGQPQGAPAQQHGGTGESLYESMMSEAKRLQAAGFIPQAQAKMKEAISVRPRYATEGRTVRGPDGKPMLVQMADDGNVRPIQGGYGLAPNMTEVDMGDRKRFVDKNAVRDGQEFKLSQSPNSVADDRRAAASRAQSAGQFNARMAFDKQQAAGSGEGMLPAETVQMMAQQYRAGDTSVMQNLGRGAQGAQNIIALRNEIARQTKEQGMGGADLAARNAEYFGTKAGQRTAGTRIANVEMASTEAQSLIPLARDASEAVARSGLLPFGKAQVMFDNQTNDPALRQFAAANNALVNVYSRAISPSGVPTVADKEHAREMISTAMDNKSYQAVLNQMEKEIVAARAAPQSVRKAFSDSVTGKGEHGAAPASGGKTISLSDIAETARKSGRTTAEVTAAARAKGYTIGGQ